MDRVRSFRGPAQLIHQLAELTFTEAGQNAVLVGGPGTGKTH